MAEPESALEPSPSPDHEKNLFGSQDGAAGPLPPSSYLVMLSNSNPRSAEYEWPLRVYLQSCQPQPKKTKEKFGAKRGLEGTVAKDGPRFNRVGSQLLPSFYLQGPCLAG